MYVFNYFYHCETLRAFCSDCIEAVDFRLSYGSFFEKKIHDQKTDDQEMILNIILG